MKVIKKIFKRTLYLLLAPIGYFIISLIFTYITIDRKYNANNDVSIYLSTNGVHLDVIIPKEKLSNQILVGVKYNTSDKYLAFGWGDENFYINTPSWSDLTFSNAFSALFLKSSTLMHVTRYKSLGNNWIEIKISEFELKKLNIFLQSSFQTNEIGNKLILKNKGYSSNDDFYKALGSYSCFNTCNSWVNRGFKNSGLKSCLWTPFDFGLLSKYN
ncbi:DUF2459 domain-containing protein [Winogradskyella endarachnes]|uniref:DUF2459 domain-containing protein n=1 Tax=Winogradskyella endarachnes TaxID=2681965 RepID=A0A6L6U963_9FLAO|nr:DUF2459 domain-containing protein [Winogradskyella endarachnes]MUU77364.1 DUF2459 domain-containing protein [Winogradskyella endarachnes]